MNDYTSRQLRLGILIDLVKMLQWLGFLALAAVLFSECPAARAEEPAYWPPCGEPGQDSRCPPAPRTPLPGHSQPELQCSP